MTSCFYLDANIELKQLDSYEARKKYVDSLYAGKESQNKVKKKLYGKLQDI